MRQVSFCVVGFALLLLALPLAAQSAPRADFPEEAGARCPAEAAPVPVGDPSQISLPEILGVPAPIKVACEHNFCTLSRNQCETSCAPCSFNFSCKGNACESICTCTC